MGEAIHNLRCALDHAVAALVPENFRDQTQYPIFTDPNDWLAKTPRMLKGVPPAIHALIEDTQPYRRLAQAPARDTLEQFRQLSNIDKHRTLTAIVSAVQHEWVGTPADVTVHWEKFGTGQTLGHGETEISVLVATSEREVEEMEMQPGFSYEVRIEGRPLDHLVPMARRVVEAVAICETGTAVSPFATYPL